jgi:polysaccharide export outer membrane protein
MSEIIAMRIGRVRRAWPRAVICCQISSTINEFLHQMQVRQRILMPKTLFRHFAFLVLCALLVVHSLSVAQTREEVRSEAESKLSRMTPEQIEARIKQAGMTREEATRKAADLGISLEQYLAGAKATQTPPAAPSAETGVVEQGPSPTTAPEPAGLTAVRTPPPTGLYGLPYFGYDIFASVPPAFEPTAVGPVDPQYVVGPDDVLRVTVWGQVEFQNELSVDKEGRIFVPTIGQVLVSGLTLEQTYQKLLKQMSRSYSGLVARNPTVWLDVTLARLRPKRVFIMGEVAQPGGYTVSSYATVFNALYSVGGPTVNGSLREVRVVRGDEVIARIDLYNYLIGAEHTNDIRVQNNDIIFVPVRGKTVLIHGDVGRPAIYELKEGENLRALLDFCGGLSTSAYTGQAQIDRIKPFQMRGEGVVDKEVVDVDLRQLLRNPERDVPLFAADEVRVFSVLDEKQNYAVVTGNVWRPGRYELGKIATLRDLISAAQGVRPKTYLPLAHLVRYNDDMITKRIIPLNLGSLLEDAALDRRLMPRDSLIIHSDAIIEVIDKYVTIRGEVKKPGRYPLDDNMVLEDLVALAGGYTESAEVLRAEVSRVMPQGLPGDTLALLIHPELPTNPSAVGRSDSLRVSPDNIAELGPRFPLQHRDEVLVVPNPNYKVQQNVSITGDILYPGVYALRTRGERLSELLTRAGGPTLTSYLGGAEFVRGGGRVSVDLEKAFRDRNSSDDIIMLGGDQIFVPTRQHVVAVGGQVNIPGLLSFITGDNVGDYIDRAGGLTDSASYAILSTPQGESRRVNFGWLRSNPEVPEASTINVLKVPAPPPAEKGEPLATTVKDIFSIVSAAATVAFIVWQTTK